jgi:polygalacturonase
MLIKTQFPLMPTPHPFTQRLLAAFTCLIASMLITHGQIKSVEELHAGLEFEMQPIQEPIIPDRTVNLLDFGGVNDGVTLNTDAFHAAFNELAKKGGGKLIVPSGTWLTGPITLQSNIEIHTEAGALILFSRNKDLYPIVESNFEGYATYRCQSPISGRNLENIAFTGRGVFDGNGDAWRPVKREKVTENLWRKFVTSGGVVSTNGRIWYPSEQFRNGEEGSDMNVPTHLRTREQFERIKDFLRPVMVSLISCKQVLFDGPTFQNSPAWNIHPLFCEDVIFRNLTVRNPTFSQNGDGIDIDSCRNVAIYDCTFDVGDDAICIKSGKNQQGRDRKFPSENIIIKNCVVYHGHGGVVVGSEMSSGVRNVHVSNCTFIGTNVGLRFKSARGRGGVVEKIYISDIRMINIPTQAISFNLYYGGMSPIAALNAGKFSEPSEWQAISEETPQFRDITMRNITCNGAHIGILLQGLPEMPIENILLENIDMQADYGVICKDASNITMRNVRLQARHLPLIEVSDSRYIVLDGLDVPTDQQPMLRAGGARSAHLQVRNTTIVDESKAILMDKSLPEGALSIIR